MRYKLLGRSGLRVSELALGAMTFGEDWGFGSALDECKRMVDVFRDRGGNFIDTAINYTNGSSEAMVGELTERTDAIVAEVTAIAHELSRSPAQVALAWLRAQPGVIMPILGARKLSQLEDNLGVLDTTLTPEQLEHLDKVSAIRMGFPHEMLREPFVRSLIYGNSFESLDDHRK